MPTSTPSLNLIVSVSCNETYPYHDGQREESKENNLTRLLTNPAWLRLHSRKCGQIWNSTWSANIAPCNKIWLQTTGRKRETSYKPYLSLTTKVQTFYINTSIVSPNYSKCFLHFRLLKLLIFMVSNFNAILIVKGIFFGYLIKVSACSQ